MSKLLLTPKQSTGTKLSLRLRRANGQNQTKSKKNSSKNLSRSRRKARKRWSKRKLSSSSSRIWSSKDWGTRLRNWKSSKHFCRKRSNETWSYFSVSKTRARKQKFKRTLKSKEKQTCCKKNNNNWSLRSTSKNGKRLHSTSTWKNRKVFLREKKRKKSSRRKRKISSCLFKLTSNPSLSRQMKLLPSSVEKLCLRCSTLSKNKTKTSLASSLLLKILLKTGKKK